MTTFHLSNSFNNFETFSESAKNWNLDFIQLEGGSFFAKLDLFGDTEFQLGDVYFNKQLHQRGSSPHKRFTFGLYHQTSGLHRWRHMECPANAIITFPKNNELHSISQHRFHKYTLTVEESLLQTVAMDIGLPDLSRFVHKGSIALCNPKTILHIQHYLTALFSQARGSTTAVEQILRYEVKWTLASLILSALAKASNVAPKPKEVRKGRIIRTALEFIESDMSTPKSIPELCKATNTTERTLRNIFYSVFSTSPSSYLKSYRLHAVRKTLRSEEMVSTTITDIANANGFWHMGQFAADYRLMFGELPSATRNRILHR